MNNNNNQKRNTNKIPLILLTGLLSDQRVFEYQVDKLKELADIIVIESTATNTSNAMVEKILHLAPNYFALAGHSMGGWLALKITKMAPEKVMKLCLLNTTAREDNNEDKANRQSMITRTRHGEFQQVANEIADRFVFNQNIKKDVLSMFLQKGGETLIKQGQAMLGREDLKEHLKTITCPTLIIHASEDKRFNLEAHQEIVNSILNAKLAIIEDCGHMSPMESPQAVTTLMRYWLEYF